jgi:hypothetical protein
VLKTLIACALTLAAPLTGADVLLLDGIDAAHSSTSLRPARGTSMTRVEAEFGPPSSQQDAVGEPPITRWDYPSFVVYFEYQYVIHAVARR